MSAFARITHDWNWLSPQRRSLLFVLLMLLASQSLVGCEEPRVVRSTWDQLPADKRPPIDNEGAQSTGCAILLKSFDGSGQDKEASRFIDRLTLTAAMPDLWKSRFKGVTNVYRGRYADPATPQAQRDLRQSRMIQVEGKRPFESVELVDLATGKPPTAVITSEIDLRRYPNQFSLQVGYYDEQSGNPRAAAERAAATLRAEGEQAFFYHGPIRSLVTVGLFDETDMSSRDGATVYSQRVKELQRRFPYNAANGRTLVEKRDGNKVRDQPSFLVRVE